MSTAARKLARDAQHGFGFYGGLAVRHERKGIRAIRIDAELLSKRKSLGQLHRNEAKIAAAGLFGATLRYAYEVRDAKEFFDDIPNVKVAPDMLKLAEHILESKEADFDPSQFRDHYEEAVVDMLKKKQAGVPASREQSSVRPQNDVNLMDALKRSIADEKRPAAPAKKGRKRIPGQGEMLLPISGKRGKEAPAKPVARPGKQKKAG